MNIKVSQLARVATSPFSQLNDFLIDDDIGPNLFQMQY